MIYNESNKAVDETALFVILGDVSNKRVDCYLPLTEFLFRTDFVTFLLLVHFIGEQLFQSLM